VVVQEVRWEKGVNAREGEYFFSMEKEMKIINWEEGCLNTTE
jgi:hypothetical protein